MKCPVGLIFCQFLLVLAAGLLAQNAERDGLRKMRRAHRARSQTSPTSLPDPSSQNPVPSTTPFPHLTTPLPSRDTDSDSSNETSPDPTTTPVPVIVDSARLTTKPPDAMNGKHELPTVVLNLLSGLVVFPEEGFVNKTKVFKSREDAFYEDVPDSDVDEEASADGEDPVYEDFDLVDEELDDSFMTSVVPVGTTTPSSPDDDDWDAHRPYCVIENERYLNSSWTRYTVMGGCWVVTQAVNPDVALPLLMFLQYFLVSGFLLPIVLTVPDCLLCKWCPSFRLLVWWFDG